jgi:plastocyanin
MRDRRWIARVGAAVGGAALVVAMASATALAANQDVGIAGFSFSPKELTINVGDNVTWTNSDAQSHTATADDGSFDTGPIPNGTPASVTFSKAGTFAYHCNIHPAMTATLVVKAASSGGGAGATPPATDTVRAGQADSAGSVALAVAAVLALAWLVGIAAIRRRLPRTR